MKQEILVETEISREIKKKREKKISESVTFLFGKGWLFPNSNGLYVIETSFKWPNGFSFRKNNGCGIVLGD